MPAFKQHQAFVQFAATSDFETTVAMQKMSSRAEVSMGRRLSLLKLCGRIYC